MLDGSARHGLPSCGDLPGEGWRRWRALDRHLAQAEKVIALLDRCRPRNLCSEVSRLRGAWEAGQEVFPQWDYLAAPDLSGWIRALQQVAEALGGQGRLGALYASRADELSLEARLVAALDTPAFRQLALRRYDTGSLRHATCATQWAESWAQLTLGPAEGAVRSDDERHPQSLVSQLRREIGARRLPVQVEVRASLATAAAAGEGMVVVRGGVSHAPGEAARIVLHEVMGHVLPRVRCREQGVGLLAIGTAGASADEEGRALLLERRAGFFSSARRRALAHRHIAAVAVRGGADWVETMRSLLHRGATTAEAVDVSVRAHRGGGLAREAVYLPALARVSEAFAEDPQLEAWFESGRISVDAARQLRAYAAPQAAPGAERGLDRGELGLVL